MASNGISTLVEGDGSNATANKEARQIAKLNLAQTRRQAGGLTTATYYRALNIYNRIYLPEAYNTDPATHSWYLIGRPWYDTSAALSTPLTLVESASTSLQIWYDGADITQFQPTNPSDAEGITQWNDKSNFAHNANPEGTPASQVRPTYQTAELNSLSVVEFDGVNDCLSINPIAWAESKNAYTLFFVAKFDNTVGTDTLSATDSDDFILRNNGTEIEVGTASGTGITSLLGLNTAYHYYTVRYDGTASGNANRLKLRVDGGDKALGFTGTVGSSTSGSITKFNIGCDGAGSNFFDGQIAEIVMFTEALSSEDITDVEGYLTSRWGL